MTSKGTILKYDSTDGSGIIMLVKGNQKKFTSKDWIDSQNQPIVHQKVNYENDESPMNMTSIAQDIINKPIPIIEKEKTIKKEFTDIDECIKYFIDKDFKIIRDTQDNKSRLLTLRSYIEGDFAEVMITSANSKISIAQKLNGKPVL